MYSTSFVRQSLGSAQEVRYAGYLLDKEGCYSMQAHRRFPDISEILNRYPHKVKGC